MNKIVLASLIVVTMPAYAMNDEPNIDESERLINNIELASIEGSTSEHEPIESDAQPNAAHADRPIHITVRPAEVNIPPQNDSALRSIAERISGIRWQQYSQGVSHAFNALSIMCMLCYVGGKISDAVRSKNLTCNCACPQCPNINFPIAPTPLVMDTTNSASNWSTTLANDTTAYSNSTYSNETATIMAMIGNMTKQKTD